MNNSACTNLAGTVCGYLRSNNAGGPQAPRELPAQQALEWQAPTAAAAPQTRAIEFAVAAAPARLGAASRRRRLWAGQGVTGSGDVGVLASWLLVPRISEFFGLVIHMYWFDTQKHKLPHIHVRYQGAEAVFALDGHLVEGALGGRAERLVQEWCAQSQGALEAAWASAIAGREIPWVLPLQ